MGDDQLVTNPKRIKDAIAQKAANALLLKINQVRRRCCAAQCLLAPFG